MALNIDDRDRKGRARNRSILATQENGRLDVRVATTEAIHF
jgi:hypothetical protein